MCVSSCSRRCRSDAEWFRRTMSDTTNAHRRPEEIFGWSEPLSCSMDNHMAALKLGIAGRWAFFGELSAKGYCPSKRDETVLRPWVAISARCLCRISYGSLFESYRACPLKDPRASCNEATQASEAFGMDIVSCLHVDHASSISKQ